MTSLQTPEELAEFPVIVEMPIEWGDMDSFRHVNNAVYIRWFETGRVAYMEKSGLPVSLTGQSFGPILASIECNYRRQLTFPDTVLIGSRVSRVGRTSMTVDHVIFSQSQQVAAADGHSIIVVFDYSANRPTRVSDEVRAAVEKLEGKSFS